ncbi:MAG TPA: hypothetical protein VNP36_11595 [Burkholderiales bacterium]|nr:hypothetical protein [Burkholderiales bacterium]
MCYDYELEYLVRRAEEARKELQKTDPREKPKPAAPVEVPEEKPVPA